MRYLHFLVAALFILFAYWQLNDPDWLLWLLSYLIVALVAGWQAYGGAPRKFIAFSMGFMVALLINRVPDLIDWLQQGTPSIVEEMKAEEPHIELTREFLGLAICLGTLVFYYLRFKPRSTTG
ncbi:MAG: transmembrane 220 family protein [Bacteroidota bacterium]